MIAKLINSEKWGYETLSIRKRGADNLAKKRARSAKPIEQKKFLIK